VLPANNGATAGWRFPVSQTTPATGGSAGRTHRLRVCTLRPL